MPFLGEVRMFGGNFAPRGWALCNGQVLAIANNDALFALIGTTYGGDGSVTFALPDLRGRLPLHKGTGLSTYTLGQLGGAESVTLTATQLPAHSHTLSASSTGSVAAPTNALPGRTTTSFAETALVYGAPASLTGFNPATILASGGSLPHDNVQPFLCVNFIIALEGVFPSRN